MRHLSVSTDSRIHVAAIVMRACGVALVWFVLLVASTGAQTASTSASDATTPQGLRPGAPAGSYSLSGFESVNLYNGNLNFHLPLLGMGGRGDAGHTLYLAIDNKRWSVRRSESGNSQMWTPSAASWTDRPANYGPGKLVGRRSGFGLHPRRGCLSLPQGMRTYTATLTTLTFVAPDGTEYDFRDKLHGGGKLAAPRCSVFPYTGASRGREFVAVDGSAATFISDADILDKTDIPSNTRTFAPSGFLLLADGTRLRIETGAVVWKRDRNGNLVSFGGGVVTDSLGRQATIETNVIDPVHGLCDRISFKGFGGAPRTIYVTKTTLGNALRAGFTPQTHRQLFPELNGADNYGSGTYNPPGMVSGVVLPDKRSYRFLYNSYGELARVELPTGAVIEYDMATGSGVINGHNSQENVREIYRRVAERRTYTDGATLESRTLYTPTGTGNSSVKVDVFDASGRMLASSTHFFIGDPRESLVGEVDGEGFPVKTYPDWNEGREFKVESFDTDGVAATVALRRTETVWEAGATLGGFPVNARVAASTTTLVDTNQVSRQEYAYDGCTGCDPFFNNQTDVKEYGYGTGGAGTLVRRTHTDYVAAAYTDAATGAHLRRLPLRQIVYDANNAVKAQTDYEYDNYADDERHEPLAPRSNIGGHDAAFGAGYATRGNVTKVTTYANAAALSGAVTTHQQYDIAGNVVKAFDARGNATTFDFADRFGAPDGEARSNSSSPELAAQSQASYAFATSVTNALGHAAYTQYDYYLGAAVDGEDANGVVTSGSYNDPLDRPTQVVRAANAGAARNQTTFAYDDANRTVTTTSDLDRYADHALKSEARYDGWGRTVETRQYESGAQYITNLQEYDGLGRAWRSSDPVRSTEAGTPEWTTTEYDALGRVRQVTTADGARVESSYLGNEVEVTDQGGRKRRSVTDALGRLVKVYEAPGDDGYNYLTSYEYDEMDNLCKVWQGAQTRTFVYDSLRRLATATNPESGTIAYEYDANGNLKKKTDARGVVTDYVYDALNRAVTRTASNVTTPQGAVVTTPAVTYTYDVERMAGSRAVGRLTSVSSTVSTTTYDRYDEMGRVTDSAQVTDGQTYRMSYGYNLAGNLTSQTYPSGKVVATEYDGAGRIAGVRNGTSGAFYAGGASTDATNRIGYTAHGAVAALRLGNGLWETTGFNGRLQVESMKLGTTRTSGDRWQIALSYGTTANNGNLLSQTITVPTVAGVIGFTAVQSYSYDALNRLATIKETRGASEDWKQKFLYDHYGNRQIDTNPAATTPALVGENPLVSPSNNRITTAGYGYDAAGNLTSAPGVHVPKVYDYDGENRQVAYKHSTATEATYGYDGDGRRVKKVVGTGSAAQTTIFVYDAAGQLVAEYGTQTSGDGGGTSYLTSDHLGSMRVVTGSGGEVKSRHDYLPFGEEIKVGAVNSGRTTGQWYVPGHVRQKFTSKEHDDETGLDYFLARYYSSTHGRFTSPDEFKGGPDELFILGSGDEEKQALPYTDITNPQSLNRYQYCLNNPLRYIDPDGHQDHDPNQKRGIVDSISDYMGSLVRRLLDQKDPAGSRQEAEDRGSNPYRLPSKDVIVERDVQMRGDGVDAAMGILELADQTGGVGALRAYAKNDRAGVGVSLSMGVLNFASPTKALGHFRKHAAEWGVGRFSNAVQYVKAARDFIGSQSGDVVRYTNSAGKVLVWNRKTNEVAVHKGKSILTFFRPKKGQAYVDDVIKRDGYKPK